MKWRFQRVAVPGASDRVPLWEGVLPVTFPLLPVGEPVPDPGGPDPSLSALPLVPVLSPLVDLPALESCCCVTGALRWSLALFCVRASGASHSAAIIATATTRRPTRLPTTKSLRMTRRCSRVFGLAVISVVLSLLPLSEFGSPRPGWKTSPTRNRSGAMRL
jgi:hypothetical protein